MPRRSRSSTRCSNGKADPALLSHRPGPRRRRTVITAAKRGSRALGIEYNPDMVELSKRNAAREGGPTSELRAGGSLQERLLAGECDNDVPAARHQHQLRPKILDSRPHASGSNSFTMGEMECSTKPPPWAKAAAPGARRTSGSFRQRWRATEAPPGRAAAEAQSRCFRARCRRTAGPCRSIRGRCAAMRSVHRRRPRIRAR